MNSMGKMLKETRLDLRLLRKARDDQKPNAEREKAWGRMIKTKEAQLWELQRLMKEELAKKG